jgi:uroporphyrinogen-III decarboxylase
MAGRSYESLVENFTAWDEAVGDIGIAYLMPGYSAMGYILNYWMGIEQTIYAAVDWNDTMHEVVDMINDNNLKIIELLADYPGEAVLMGDNFSSDIQPPSFFREWSETYYKKAFDIFHSKGKKVAIHVDGRLRGAIKMIRDCGADIIDAVTPVPMGDLTPAQCRDEAGNKLILSGGVSPDLWLPSAPLAAFEKAVTDWLGTRKTSPALIAAAGDQVPPQADEHRIEIMRDLVEKHGKY